MNSVAQNAKLFKHKMNEKKAQNEQKESMALTGEKPWIILKMSDERFLSVRPAHGTI